MSSNIEHNDAGLAIAYQPISAVGKVANYEQSLKLPYIILSFVGVWRQSEMHDPYAAPTRNAAFY
jgi:hypothetical protein